MVTQPGFYPDMSDDDYHADPAPTPSLSSSLARTICERSLLHAKFQSPRFGERQEKEPSAAMIFGTALHSLALGSGAEVVAVDADDWRAKDARAARDAIVAAGKIPLKRADFDRAHAMAGVIRPLFVDLTGEDGLSEQAMFWQAASGGWRRGKIDRMSADGAVVADYKTVGETAEPEAAGRSLYANGYHIQQALYSRGLDALLPATIGRRRFYFVVQEQSPPYAYSVHALAGEGLAIAEAQVDFAERAWDAAVATGSWPGYGRTVHHVPMPSYLAQRWYGAALRDEARQRVEDLLDAEG